MNMARRNPPAKWVLPSVVNPTARKTITLCIPDEPQHIAAFRGAMQALGSAYNWADDEAHTAKDVAQVWRNVIDAGDSCMEFRQDGCHLYLVANGIETLIYNGQECIDANIADGTLAKTNSGYIGNIAHDSCHTYTARLTIDQNWIAPNAVNSGDTLLLSNWQGGATDLGQLGDLFWICPSGTAYALGSCSDTGRSATMYGTDPLQTAPHLAVIAQIGTAYYDVWNSVSGITPAEFTVPSGITNQPLRLLMNIGSLVGNVATGEMWGEVTLCNKAVWCHSWNFVNSDQGWMPYIYQGNPLGRWVNGRGWHSNYPIDDWSDNLSIAPPEFPTGNITSVTFITESAWTGISPYIYVASYPGLNEYVHDTSQGWTSHQVGVVQTLTRFYIGMDRQVGGNQAWDNYLTGIELRGVGANPYETSNCS